MGQIVYPDKSSLNDKIEKFINFRSEKRGKPFKEMTLWENKEKNCHYDDDEIVYINLITKHRERIILEEEENGVWDDGEHKPQNLKLKFYSTGETNNDLIIECYLTDVQDEKNPHIIKEIHSFVSYMINKEPDQIVQLQRYDLIGKTHQNKIIKELENTLSVAEKILLKNYFWETAELPHFHFSSNKFQDKLAINLDNLIIYIEDLIESNDNNELIRQHSLGMPFLQMKEQENDKKIDLSSFVNHVEDKLYRLARKYCGVRERSIIEKINKKIYACNLANLSTNSLEACLRKLYILRFLNKLRKGSERGLDPNFVAELNNLQLQIANGIITDLENEKNNDKNNDSYNEKDDYSDNGREL